LDSSRQLSATQAISGGYLGGGHGGVGR
jgi:hypothetical protein